MAKQAAPAPLVVTPLIVSRAVPLLVMLNVLVSDCTPTISAPKSVPLVGVAAAPLAITAPLVPRSTNSGPSAWKVFVTSGAAL